MEEFDALLTEDQEDMGLVTCCHRLVYWFLLTVANRVAVGWW